MFIYTYKDIVEWLMIGAFAILFLFIGLVSLVDKFRK
jgi:hypothetical protein